MTDNLAEQLFKHLQRVAGHDADIEVGLELLVGLV